MYVVKHHTCTIVMNVHMSELHVPTVIPQACMYHLCENILKLHIKSRGRF